MTRMTTTREGTRYYDWANGDVVTVSGTSAQSDAFTQVELLLCSTTNCWITVGSNPTAAANTDDNLYLPAGVMFHLRIDPASKVAVIQASAGGHLSIIPVD